MIEIIKDIGFEKGLDGGADGDLAGDIGENIKESMEEGIDGGNISRNIGSLKEIYVDENFMKTSIKASTLSCSIQRRSGKIWNHDSEQKSLAATPSNDMQIKYESGMPMTFSGSSDTESLLTIERQETLDSDKILDSLDGLSERSDTLLDNTQDLSNSLVSDPLNALKKPKSYRRQPIRHIFKEKVYKEFPWESFQEKYNLLSKEEFHRSENSVKNNLEKKKPIKFKSFLSIIEEISKSTSELSNANTDLRYVEMPASFYEGSIAGSDKSIDTPFPSPTISLQQKENIYGNEEIEEELSNRASLFRRSIFGGYIPEGNFQSIRSTLKEIAQHNKELRRKKGLSNMHIQNSSVENGSTNNLINSNISNSAKNDLKSDKFSKVNKKSQNNSTFTNKFSEFRQSLQETSNLNSSFESLLESYKNSKSEAIKRDSNSTFTSNVEKDIDGKSISREKNTKNISFETKRTENNENISPGDNSLFNSENSNKIDKNYNCNNANILNFDQVNKQMNLGNLSSVNSCNKGYPTHTEQFNEDKGFDLNSNRLSSWLLYVKNKYQNINLEKTHDVSNSTDIDAKHTSQVENNQIIDMFSFSKLGNKSFFTVKRTLNSLKKK